MPTRPGLHAGCHLPFHAIGCPDWTAKDFALSCAVQAQFILEDAREFEADAQEAAEAGFPDVAEEAMAEAREARQAAKEMRRLARP